MLLFTGTSTTKLASEVATILKRPIQNAHVSKFSDGEIRVEVMSHVRGQDVYIIQSTCSPANDTLMELVLLTDALKRSSANKVTAIIPYYGYARQDRRPGYARVPVSARVVANLLESAGVDHVVTCDIHAAQIGGFFSKPFDNISATQLFVGDICSKWHGENSIVVSPDVGGVARARHVAKYLDNTDLAIVDKRRPKANVSEVMNIIGDVEGKTCIMVDDMIDTAGTLCKAADALIDHGAERVVAYATHGIFSGKAQANIEQSKIHEIVVADTIPRKIETSKVRHLSVASLLAETITRIEEHKSISQILD
jgi:ribose-phosphate pyrophosphokinase